MRILFALILTYCFGGVFPEGSDDELEIGKFYSARATEDALKINENPWAISSTDKRAKTYRRYSRKLFSYPERNILKNHINNQQFREGRTKNLVPRQSQLQKKEESSPSKKNENADENHNDLWDDWGNWSTCSVTCGSGRQVRWRHCSSENCTNGLKKAQIKTCQLKNCDSKNLLNWLGIKS